MTLLVISPDYASHLLPLLTLASAWSDAGERVVVATGPATRPLVDEAGFEYVELRLGRGSNPGIIRAEQQPVGEDDNLRAFFAATREGMVATLRYQADARRSDLLWDPVNVGGRVLDVVDEVRPDQVLVDHLAFGATLALRAGGVPYGDVVLGHPSALPVGDEIYGVPPSWPACFDAEMTDAAIDGLRAQGAAVRDGFTAAYNEAMSTLAPGAAEVDDAFAAHGELVLYNFPRELADPDRTPSLPPHVFLGSAVRAEQPDHEVAAWLDGAGDRPLVHVSFGTFLSARADVLSRVVEALASLDVRVSLAIGSADPAVVGPWPDHWLVRPYLPQVALLDHAAVVVTHGGNNSVTESLAAGVPMLVLPFSTDQFAGAADIERLGVGRTLPPNTATSEEIAGAVAGLLLVGAAQRTAAAAVGEDLRRRPGLTVARSAMTGRPWA
ncbi:MAG: glycosyltransferase [Ilumatobacter sp.]|nr:MAG: glycosyltransferase [Ilumatobacter sp.]